jgi:pimeloyl-ACP methyl ester carboxylesterase
MTGSGDVDVLGRGREIPTRLGDLYVREVGSGPPAALWHSLFVDSTTWARVAAPLAAERHLILIDGPGHGRSRGPDHDYTLGDCGGAACDVLDHLGIDGPVDWLGNAWGGHVGIQFAVGQPRRCRSLLTVGTPTHPLEPEIRRKMVPALLAYRMLGPIGPLVAGFTGALVDRSTDDREDVGLVADAFRRAHRPSMARAMRCISLRRPDLTPLLASAAAPSLFVAGEDDALWRPDQARAAARRLPLGAAAALPGAGHVAPLLRSATPLADLVTRFWRDPVGVVASLLPSDSRVS